MERYDDPTDPLNSAQYHSGNRCFERGCERPAGTAWSPYWCQRCNAARMRGISARLAKTSKARIAARLRKLAEEMDDIAVAMDYYGGFAEWSKHGRKIAGAGTIARQWAAEIEAE